MDVIEVDVSKEMMKELGTALHMCTHNSQRKTLDDAEVQNLWFEMLDVFVHMLRRLKYGFRNSILPEKVKKDNHDKSKYARKAAKHTDDEEEDEEDDDDVADEEKQNKRLQELREEKDEIEQELEELNKRKQESTKEKEIQEIDETMKMVCYILNKNLFRKKNLVLLWIPRFVKLKNCDN